MVRKDPNKWCRLCLKEEDNLQALYIDNMLNRIESFLETKVLMYFNWPQNICEECTQFLDQLVVFRNNTLDNQNRLLNEFGEGFFKEEITIEDDLENDDFSLDINDFMTNDLLVEVTEDPVNALAKKSPRVLRKTVIKRRATKKGSSLKKKIAKEDKISVEERDSVIKEFMVIKCDICKEKGFSSFMDLMVHSRNQHETQFPKIRCEICNNIFRKRSQLYDHIMVHRDPTKYTCDECQKSFPSFEHLKAHKKMHWPKSKWQFQCDECEKRFLTETRLKEHKISHIPVNERLFKCELCKRRCGSQTVLQFHMLNHCKDNENLVCDVCAKTFSSRAALKHHIGTHENEQIECPKCKKVMRNKRSLYFHNRNIHSEEGPFRCEECDHNAPNKRALTKHSNRNHNPISDQFKCKYCGKASKTKLTHREHEATHTELRLYTCKFCNLGFNSNANKYKHQKQKHPIEWEKWNQEKNT